MTTIPGGRAHIVLVPGFAGFDALGQIEYYAGTTKSYERWLKNGGSPGQAAVLHHFDNLPTAGVATRADRLRTYLAKRIARGEIHDTDRIALVGHSTGGLEIRRLLLATGKAPPGLHLDGGARADKARRATAIDVDQRKILKKVERVVFISVPQYGTNIADWVRSRATLRRVAIEGLLLAVDGASSPRLEEIESCLLGALASVARKPDLVLAAKDALRETKASRRDPIRRANAEEAASQLRLWLRHAVDDFGAIDDLTSFTKPPKNSMSPAHYSEAARDHEREQWRSHRIRTMSIATLSRRAFKFNPGELAAPWDLLQPQTRPTRRPHDRRPAPTTSCQPATTNPAVRPDIYRLDTPTSHHLHGEPPERGDRRIAKWILPAQADVSGAAHPKARGATDESRLGGHGAPDGHMTGSQAHKWPGKYFTPAVRKVAEEWPDEHGDIVGATPYSLRRGMISLRIRAGEDRQAIVKQCGTSVEMLERSYSFAIEDLEDEGSQAGGGGADPRAAARSCRQASTAAGRVSDA